MNINEYWGLLLTAMGDTTGAKNINEFRTKMVAAMDDNVVLGTVIVALGGTITGATANDTMTAVADIATACASASASSMSLALDINSAGGNTYADSTVEAALDAQIVAAVDTAIDAAVDAAVDTAVDAAVDTAVNGMIVEIENNFADLQAKVNELVTAIA